jgi:hypothetical protein
LPALRTLVAPEPIAKGPEAVIVSGCLGRERGRDGPAAAAPSEDDSAGAAGGPSGSGLISLLGGRTGRNTIFGIPPRGGPADREGRRLCVLVGGLGCGVPDVRRADPTGLGTGGLRSSGADMLPPFDGEEEEACPERAGRGDPKKRIT